MEDIKRFAIEECMLFSVRTGLQTRNKSFPVYNSQHKELSNRQEIQNQTGNSITLKQAIVDFLDKYMEEIKATGVSEDIHNAKIQEMADLLTKQFKPVLYQGRFRIGVSQKIINLFLKYMWSLGEIPEPWHCPVDGIVKSIILVDKPSLELIDWTRLDDINDYLKYIEVIRELAATKNQSIAVWELENWGRR